MKHIQTEIEIEAKPERIWKILTDFAFYPEWNPFIVSIVGKPAINERLVVKLQPPGGSIMTFKPVIKELEENESLIWKGKLLYKGLFDGRHYFRLEVLSSKKVKFIHGERFSGLLVGMLSTALKKTEEGFILMNEALKNRAESNKDFYSPPEQ